MYGVDICTQYENMKATKGEIDYSIANPSKFEGKYKKFARKFSNILCTRLSDMQ